MIAFRELNERLPRLPLLRALNLECHSYTVEYWRGRCPFHDSRSRRSRSLAVSIALGKFLCHRCGAHGDLIDLWAGVRNLALPVAARELQERFG